MPLTDVAVRNARPGVHPTQGQTGKLYRLYDRDGLYLEVHPAGGKYWRAKYRFGGKEKRLALGVYPAIGLKDARRALEDARRQLDQGLDPAVQRHIKKTEVRLAGDHTFASVAAAWFQARRPEWSEVHAGRLKFWLENEIDRALGRVPVSQITAPLVSGLGLKIAQRGAIETSRRVVWLVGQVLEWAAGQGLVERNVAGAAMAVLPKPLSRTYPAVTEPDRLAEILRAIQGVKVSETVRCAIQCLPYLAVRPGNLRLMEWAEVDLAGATWTIPPAKMKRGVSDKIHGAAFKVPLSRQVLQLLTEQQALTGARRYVFPGVRGEARPISDGTLGSALMAAGIPRTEHVPHGFRATFRTLAVERLGIEVHIAEAALAHVSSEELGSSYDRATYLDARRPAMQRWADYLDALRDQTSALSQTV